MALLDRNICLSLMQVPSSTKKTIIGSRSIGLYGSFEVSVSVIVRVIHPRSGKG